MNFLATLIILLPTLAFASPSSVYVDRLNQKLAESGAIVYLHDDFIEVSLPRKILFDFDKFNTSESIATIEALADVMKAMPSRTVIITGHTDPSGSDAYNIALARSRANAVKSELVKQGIEVYRITVIAKGEMSPPEPIPGIDFNRLSRRVELEIK